MENQGSKKLCDSPKACSHESTKIWTQESLTPKVISFLYTAN